MDSFDSINTVEGEDQKKTLERKLSESHIQTISTSTNEEDRASSYAALMKPSSSTKKEQQKEPEKDSEKEMTPKFPNLPSP